MVPATFKTPLKRGHLLKSLCYKIEQQVPKKWCNMGYVARGLDVVIDEGTAQVTTSARGQITHVAPFLG